MRELVNGRLLIAGEPFLSSWELACGEPRHQPVGVRSHQVRDLGLLAEPRQVLRSLEAPPTRPTLCRRVAVEGGDEIDEELSHGALLPKVWRARPGTVWPLTLANVM